MGRKAIVEESVAEPHSTLWRHVNFLLLMTGTTVSLLGTAVSGIAVPLTAVLMLNATAQEMGLLRAVAGLPFLFFALFAGVWADRLRRQPVLIGTDLGRALLLFSIPVTVALGSLHFEQLYAVAFLMGLLGVFSEAAQGAFLPTIVRRDQLVEANTRLEAARSFSQVTGPGLAGLLVQLVTAPFAVVADAVSYLISAALISRIQTGEEQTPPNGRSRGMWSAIGEGLGVVWNHPVLRAIAFGQGIFGFFTSLLEAVYILYVMRELGVAPGLLGVIFAVGSFGNLLGAFVSATAVRRLGVSTTMVTACIVSGLSTFALPLTSIVSTNTAFVLLVTRQLLGGIALVTYMINQVSIRQALTPNQLQGRVGVTMRLISRGSAPVGALLGGLLGGYIGLQETLLIGACGFFAGSLWVIASPVRTLKDPLTYDAS